MQLVFFILLSSVSVYFVRCSAGPVGLGLQFHYSCGLVGKLPRLRLYDPLASCALREAINGHAPCKHFSSV